MFSLFVAITSHRLWEVWRWGWEVVLCVVRDAVPEVEYISAHYRKGLFQHDTSPQSSKNLICFYLFFLMEFQNENKSWCNFDLLLLCNLHYGLVQDSLGLLIIILQNLHRVIYLINLSLPPAFLSDRCWENVQGISFQEGLGESLCIYITDPTIIEPIQIPLGVKLMSKFSLLKNQDSRQLTQLKTWLLDMQSTQ